jgi:hypothetical protein
MDPIDTTVTIADWLSDSYLRSVVITCIMTGFALGFLLGKYAFGFLRWYIVCRQPRRWTFTRTRPLICSTPPRGKGIRHAGVSERTDSTRP